MDETARRKLRDWCERSGVRLCVIFGSASRGETHAESDVDVALLFETLPPASRRLETVGEVQDCVAGRLADVVFLHEGRSPILRFEVFRTGVPVFEKEPGVYEAEKLRAWKLYDGALPFRRALRRRPHQPVGEGPGVT